MLVQTPNREFNDYISRLNPLITQKGKQNNLIQEYESQHKTRIIMIDHSSRDFYGLF